MWEREPNIDFTLMSKWFRSIFIHLFHTLATSLKKCVCVLLPVTKGARVFIKVRVYVISLKQTLPTGLMMSKVCNNDGEVHVYVTQHQFRHRQNEIKRQSADRQSFDSMLWNKRMRCWCEKRSKVEKLFLIKSQKKKMYTIG